MLVIVITAVVVACSVFLISLGVARAAAYRNGAVNEMSHYWDCEKLALVGHWLDLPILSLLLLLLVSMVVTLIFVVLATMACYCHCHYHYCVYYYRLVLLEKQVELIT